jgi:predicted Fe-Mo cluster-binding NifX family protein
MPLSKLLEIADGLEQGARSTVEEIGKAIVETLRDHRSNAVLLKNHGVFAIGNLRHAGMDCRHPGPQDASGHIHVNLMGSGSPCRNDELVL